MFGHPITAARILHTLNLCIFSANIVSYFISVSDQFFQLTRKKFTKILHYQTPYREINPPISEEWKISLPSFLYFYPLSRLQNCNQKKKTGSFSLISNNSKDYEGTRWDRRCMSNKRFRLYMGSMTEEFRRIHPSFSHHQNGKQSPYLIPVSCQIFLVS